MTFDSALEITGLFLLAIVMTVVLVIVALQAVMSTIRVRRMVGEIGRERHRAAYLASRLVN